MKKLVRNTLIPGLLLLMMSIHTTHAQKLKYGAVAGMDLTNWISTNLPAEYNSSIFKEPLISYNVNFYMGYRWSDHLGNSIEPGYIRKGINRGHKIMLHYVQLPLLTDFYVVDRFFVSIGPELGYLLNAKTNQEGLYNVTDIFDNRIELSGVVGVNYNINKNFDVGLRFNHGITCIDKITLTSDTNGEITGESKIYNRYIQGFIRFII
jgi:hypothetical protein